jgi:hypothetical protein
MKEELGEDKCNAAPLLAKINGTSIMTLALSLLLERGFHNHISQSYRVLPILAVYVAAYSD